MKIKENSYTIISLGCAKNTVDSHSMADLLQRAGYTSAITQEEAEVIIVNTCGFIEQARQESMETIAEILRTKKKNQILITGGCLTQLYPKMVGESGKGINAVFGTRRWMDIVEVLNSIKDNSTPQPYYYFPSSDHVGTDEKGILRAAVQGGSAYLKIADGCRHSCAYCSIPLIKGQLTSRPIARIIEDAKKLEQSGIQEVILIAQDTTDFGHDLGISDGLATLLSNLCQEVPSIPWLRILYNYPGLVSDKLIDVMASSPQILPYFDIPLQHAHPEVLKKMHRPSNLDWVHQTIEKMRKAMPDLTLRTTFIVGYPGETESEFQYLVDFIKEIQFDHIGVFPFSFEAGTPSEPYGDPISSEVKLERTNRIMEVQEKISLKKNRSFIGKKLDVLIEGVGDGLSVGRSYRDAPEIDGLMIINNEAPIGKIIKVKVTDAMAHDLVGKLI